MKKYLIGGIVAAAFIAYAIFANNNSTQSIAAGAPSGTPNAGGPTSTTPTTTPPADNPPGTSASGAGGTPTTTTGQYKNGTYTGAVADAFYGNLQVKAIIQGGALTGITFLQEPSGGHSGRVSAIALPQLTQEAVAAQSANVDIVSGATQVSQAFQQSLASALAQAKS